MADLSDGHDHALTPTIPKIDVVPVPNSTEATLMLRSVGESAVMAWSNVLLAEPSGIDAAIVLSLLHTAANLHRIEGRHPEAQALFERILEHTPADYNVRVALAEYASARGDTKAVYDLILPALPSLLPTAQIFRDVLGRFCRIAFELHDFESASAVFDVIGSADSLLADGDETAIAIREHLSTLKQLGVLELLKGANFYGVTANKTELVACLFALDEYDLLRRVGQVANILAPDDEVDSVAVRIAWAVAEVAAVHRWTRPYRSATRLVSRLLAACDDARGAIDVLISSGISDNHLHALLTCAINASNKGLSGQSELASLRPTLTLLSDENVQSHHTKRDLGETLKLFQAKADIDTAQAVWESAYEHGAFDRLIRYAPSGRYADPTQAHVNDPFFRLWSAAAAVYSLSPADDNGPAVWYFITWHAEVEQLFRQFASLSRKVNTYIVSIGGSDPLSRFSHVSALLLAGDVHFLHRPSVSWGGQKLLFYNVFEALEYFSARSADDALFQIICNRTYPLTGPCSFAKIMGEPGHRQVYARRRYSIPPPAWHSEWPEDMVAGLPEIYNRAIDDVFTNADIRRFMELATYRMIYDSSDFRFNASSFNFSRRPLALEDEFKGGGQQYMISGHSADMRWMSFGRLTNFVDLMNETGHTYSRRSHPRTIKWIHSVLSRHNLRTGDPFVLMSRRFVDTILTDPGCQELFAACDVGFAPEMNFFDTVSYTPSYGLLYELSHQYFRTATNIASEADVPAASFAAEVQKLLFMRKMLPEVSAPFIRNFADLIVEEQGCGSFFISARTAHQDVAKCLPPELIDFLPADMVGLRFRLRDLRGQVHFAGSFGVDGTLWHDGDILSEGTWQTTSNGISVLFSWGRKDFEQIATDGSKLILPPSEIVSVRNAWGLFMEIDLKELVSRKPASPVVTAVFTPDQVDGWASSFSLESAILSNFEHADPSDYPAAISRPIVSVTEIRHVRGRYLALAEVDGFPALARLHTVSFADGRAAWTWQRASAECLELWKSAISGPASIELRPVDLVGRYEIRAMSALSDIALLADGRIVDATDADLGFWHAEGGAVWFFGIPGLPVARASQFQFNDEGWTLSGWAQQTLAKTVSFRALRAVDNPSQSN
ncbi:hypothetical protein [Methylobacterium sp. SI9]|uniref:tetratricopeptide repeat protein n=1 Tax=Methylobacterium guangdongense TaxID=3138811 RepID=UPI00313C6230